jgi:hypothetical protein
MDVAYAVKFGAVYVPKRKVKKQVATGKYTQLSFERISPLRAYAFEKFDVGVEIGQNLLVELLILLIRLVGVGFDLLSGICLANGRIF